MELEISGVRRRSTRRREVFIVVLLVVLFSVAAFLIGYFAMKAEKNTVICRPGDGRDGNGKKPKEKYHDMFQEEIHAKNIEENLRWELSLILFTYAKGLRNEGIYSHCLSPWWWYHGGFHKLVWQNTYLGGRKHKAIKK